jgi:ribulose-5-phosphate 4-epimerase/fuculose-1-phosphate aldolase
MLNPHSQIATKAHPVIDDGVTKFKLTLKMAPPLPSSEVISLEKWRAILWRLGMIGEYPKEKIGYGNLSQRLPLQKGFVITGTQTGSKPHLKREHYCRVISCDPARNSVVASGQIGPSSESLTHFAIYESNSNVHAIFHIHHRELWEKMIATNAESISEKVNYGTPEMALEAKKAINGKDSGAFVMKGHQDGIIAYGTNPEEAGKILLKLYRELGPQTDL